MHVQKFWIRSLVTIFVCFVKTFLRVRWKRRFMPKSPDQSLINILRIGKGNMVSASGHTPYRNVLVSIDLFIALLNNVVHYKTVQLSVGWRESIYCKTNSCRRMCSKAEWAFLDGNLGAKIPFCTWKCWGKLCSHALGKIHWSIRSTSVSAGGNQCDQVWRNSAILVKF